MRVCIVMFACHVVFLQSVSSFAQPAFQPTKDSKPCLASSVAAVAAT